MLRRALGTMRQLLRRAEQRQHELVAQASRRRRNRLQLETVSKDLHAC